MIHANSSTFSASLSLGEDCGVRLSVPAFPDETQADPGPKGAPEPGCAAEKLREESLYCFCYGQFFNSRILSGANQFFFVLFFS